MVDKEKTDSLLGYQVHKALLDAGCETPMIATEPAMIEKNAEDKIKEIEEAVDLIMVALGLDLKDDSLRKTPHRVGKMYVNEVFYGLDYKNFPRTMTIENKMGFNSMIVERKIKVHSFCEHHLLPFIGEAVIAYVPKDRIIGLSKLNRVVDFFCRRPQVQERLGEQIYAALSYLLDTENVAVQIRAEHFCVKMRGVMDVNSDTVTTKLGGVFFNSSLRNEFYQAIKL